MKIRIHNTSERILPHCVVVLRCVVVVDYDVALATSWLCLYISELSEPEGTGGDRPPNFGRSVNPISTRGGQVMPTTFLLAPPVPGFSDLPTALYMVVSTPSPTEKECRWQARFN